MPVITEEERRAVQAYLARAPDSTPAAYTRRCSQCHDAHDPALLTDADWNGALRVLDGAMLVFSPVARAAVLRYLKQYGR